jgi:hypothetical protein
LETTKPFYDYGGLLFYNEKEFKKDKGPKGN